MEKTPDVLVWKDYEFSEEARELAAQCWCLDETCDLEMDPLLAEAFARRLANWMGTAAQNQRNADYYRGLLIQCGELLGEEAYRQDDGNLSEDVLCAKIPALVDELIEKILIQ